MRTICRIVLAAILLAPLSSTLGCKDEGKPNPDLKAPDVPPSGSGGGKAGPAGGGSLSKPK
jgi:hypothetical protein